MTPKFDDAVAAAVLHTHTFNTTTNTIKTTTVHDHDYTNTNTSTTTNTTAHTQADPMLFGKPHEGGNPMPIFLIIFCLFVWFDVLFYYYYSYLLDIIQHISLFGWYIISISNKIIITRHGYATHKNTHMARAIV